MTAKKKPAAAAAITATEPVGGARIGTGATAAEAVKQIGGGEEDN